MPEFIARNRSRFGGLVAIGGLIATACALIVAAALAIFFAATVAVIALLGGVLLGLAGLAMRARRTVKVRRPADDGVIEARRIGGHQWVAYGWNERSN